MLRKLNAVINAIKNYSLQSPIPFSGNIVYNTFHQLSDTAFVKLLDIVTWCREIAQLKFCNSDNSKFFQNSITMTLNESQYDKCSNFNTFRVWLHYIINDKQSQSVQILAKKYMNQQHKLLNFYQ